MTKPSLSPNSRSAVRTQWRQAVLTLLEQEHTPAHLASQLGIAPWTAREIVNDLRREHLVTRVARGCYRRASPDATVPEEPVRLIRDQLLDYLAEPRQVSDIARYIERSSSVATGHLNRLQRNCLVKRVAYGIYVRSDCWETAPRGEPFSNRSEILNDILAELFHEKTLDALCRRFVRSEHQVQQYLTRLVLEGVIERVGNRGFRQVQPNLFPDVQRQVREAPG